MKTSTEIASRTRTRSSRRVVGAFAAVLIAGGLSAWASMGCSNEASVGANESASDLAEITHDVAPHSALVISQIYGGDSLEKGDAGTVDGTSGNGFIELFNLGSAPVSLKGARIESVAAGGLAREDRYLITLSETQKLAPGAHYLVRLGALTDAADAGADAGPTASLAEPDLVAGTGHDLFPIFSDGMIMLYPPPVGDDGGAPTSSLLDSVSYGRSTTNDEGAVAPALTTDKALTRKGNGCNATLVNHDDFELDAPAPRNTNAAATTCSSLDASVDAASDASDASHNDASDASHTKPDNAMGDPPVPPVGPQGGDYSPDPGPPDPVGPDSPAPSTTKKPGAPKSSSGGCSAAPTGSSSTSLLTAFGGLAMAFAAFARRRRSR